MVIIPNNPDFCSCDLNLTARVSSIHNHEHDTSNNIRWKRRWKLKGERDYINNDFDQDESQDSYSSANSHLSNNQHFKDFDSNQNRLFKSSCSSSNVHVCLRERTDYLNHHHDLVGIKMKGKSNSTCHNNLNCLELFKKTFKISSPFSSVTLLNFLVIFAVLSTPGKVGAFPTNDCDWIGSGTPENVVQAVYLRCQQGQIVWERPRGGLRVNISPPPYLFRSISSEKQPFRLCLESNVGSNFQVFLEQNGSEEDRKLLPFLSPESTNCYRIGTPTATLYVESQNQQEEEVDKTHTSSRPKEAYQVKISYEIEDSKSKGGFSSDDECRPCTDQEVLQIYCVADVVAKGEIISVRPSAKRKGMDSLHIKSNLVIHQNHPVFQPLKPGNKNLQKFLAQEIRSFDEDSPKKMFKSSKSSLFRGILSHPTKCAAQSGPGDFLWLVKLSFGRPKIACVIYWDKWTQLAREAVESGSANCPLVYQ